MYTFGLGDSQKHNQRYCFGESKIVTDLVWVNVKKIGKGFVWVSVKKIELYLVWARVKKIIKDLFSVSL